MKEKTVEVIYNILLLKTSLTLEYSHKTFLVPHFSKENSGISVFFTTFTKYAQRMPMLPANNSLSVCTTGGGPTLIFYPLVISEEVKGELIF